MHCTPVTGTRSYITWSVCAHAIDSCETMFYCMGPLPSYGRHRSFALFLGRPVCQLLYRMDVEICTGKKNEMFYSRNKICLTESYRMTSCSRTKLLWHFYHSYWLICEFNLLVLCMQNFGILLVDFIWFFFKTILAAMIFKLSFLYVIRSRSITFEHNVTSTVTVIVNGFTRSL